MPEKRCQICSREYTGIAEGAVTPEYSINFNEVCIGCSVVLSKALYGITVLLRDAHGEKRERTIAKLIERLNEQGFDTTNFGRRTA